MSKITSYNGTQPVYNEKLALEYLETITEFLTTKAKEVNASGFVVGISGGIDSSLVYAISKRIKHLDTIGVVMPVNQMTKTDLEHISQLEKAFEDKFITVDLSTAFSGITQAMSLDNQLAIANIKPRLRMTTVYALAQQNNKLVLGTDNADEVFIGYFTKYGDGGADLLPISHLTKGEVKFLASLLGVPDSIISKDPSAGLWEGQTDEDELGFSYASLDFYLNNYKKLTNEQLEEVLGKETIQKILHKHKISQHKRDGAYVPIKIE
ncbi:NAD(+) synthase [Mycoplasma corogypsi]|uniref:NAD(+) synthase n=1 Tax=Mycoplasma corogypsi TaxID=2106 RepID=UPI003872E8B5